MLHTVRRSDHSAFDRLNHKRLLGNKQEGEEVLMLLPGDGQWRDDGDRLRHLPRHEIVEEIGVGVVQWRADADHQHRRRCRDQCREADGINNLTVVVVIVVVVVVVVWRRQHLCG